MFTNVASESFANRPETPQERAVYGYVRELAWQNDPDMAIEWFYQLLLKGQTSPAYDPEREVFQALRQILRAETEHLPFIINRCFYTIGNTWRRQPTSHGHLETLVDRAQQVDQARATSQPTRKLIRGMKDYVHSEELNLYVPLQRQMRLLSHRQQERQTYVGDRFRDYFFIYESAAVTRDISRPYRESIRAERQRRVQQLHSQLHEFWRASKTSGGAAINPTRLPDEELKQVIHTFHPKQQNSYLQQAQQFDQQCRRRQLQGGFVDRFHSYIIDPLVQESESFRHNPCSRLIKQTLEHDLGPADAPITPMVITHLCTRLLKTLVSDTAQSPNAENFIKMLTVAGHRVVTAMLLKIVLFRRTVRSWFEDRFGILFNHWEQSPVEDVPWLITAFEYMNVALALNAPALNYVRA